MKEALLVIDVQQALAQAGPYRYPKVYVNIGRLIDGAHAGNVPIVFVQHTEPSGEFREGSETWKLVAGLDVHREDHRIVKAFNSAFKDTGLDPLLRGLGVDAVVIVGMQTEFCIDATAKGAFERGYRVSLPEMTNTTLDNPILKAAKTFRFYNEFLFPNTIAIVEPVETILGRWR